MLAHWPERLCNNRRFRYGGFLGYVSATGCAIEDGVSAVDCFLATMDCDICFALGPQLATGEFAR